MRVCEIEGCKNTSENKQVSYRKEFDKILCGKHNRQLKVFGEIRKTRCDENDMLEKEETIEIILSDKDRKETGRVVIDKEDYDKVKGYKWHLNYYGYAIGRQINTNEPYIWLQNLIMDNKNLEFTIDHKDLNPLNCLKSNLRKVGKSENSYNTAIRINNTSGVTGVQWLKHQEMWCAEIRNHKKRVLKYTHNFDEAVKYRIKFEAEYAKEHSNNYNFDTQTIQLTYLNPHTNLQMFIESNLQGEILTHAKLPPTIPK